MGKKIFFSSFLPVILCRRNYRKLMNDTEFRKKKKKKKEKMEEEEKKGNKFSPFCKLKELLFCFSFGIIGNNGPRAEPDR